MAITAAGAAGRAEYPASITVQPPEGPRNRLTVAFRPILAIPHLILVGGMLAVGPGLFWGAGGGVLGVVAGVAAVIAWFAILFANTHPRGLWDLADMYLRWRVRAVAYLALFRDEYPPFGDAAYPAAFETSYPDAARDKWSVGLRIFYVIPHLVVLFFLGIAWIVTTIIAWFAILFTGRYPEGLYGFGLGVMRWSFRVEAYALLMRDEYPPFSLE